MKENERRKNVLRTNLREIIAKSIGILENTLIEYYTKYSRSPSNIPYMFHLYFLEQFSINNINKKLIFVFRLIYIEHNGTKYKSYGK